jgi:hypothetical protein
MMGPRKSRCDVPSGTTQGQDCPFGCSHAIKAHLKCKILNFTFLKMLNQVNI